jgi:hypothetical protein
LFREIAIEIGRNSNGAFRAARPLLTELGDKDRSRLEKLIGLVGPGGVVSLGAVLEAAFPGQPREAALTASEQRSCWFAGDDSAAAELSAVSEPAFDS